MLFALSDLDNLAEVLFHIPFSGLDEQIEENVVASETVVDPSLFAVAERVLGHALQGVNR
jgi:hypothetical protein